VFPAGAIRAPEPALRGDVEETAALVVLSLMIAAAHCASRPETRGLRDRLSWRARMRMVPRAGLQLGFLVEHDQPWGRAVRSRCLWPASADRQRMRIPRDRRARRGAMIRSSRDRAIIASMSDCRFGILRTLPRASRNTAITSRAIRSGLGRLPPRPRSARCSGKTPGAWAAAVWRPNGVARAPSIWRAWPGRGTLMADACAPRKRCRRSRGLARHLVEMSDVLAAIQARDMALRA